jgi:hypothetical protein
VEKTEGGESRKEVSSSERSLLDAEEKKAKEELENFLAAHRPEKPATHEDQQTTRHAQHGADAQQQSQPEPATWGDTRQQTSRRGVVETKSKDEILKEIEELLKKYGEF